LDNVYDTVAVPGEIPFRSPAVPTRAIAVLLLLQSPLPVALLSDVTSLSHILIVPVIATGAWFIVITVVARQPLAKLYEIMDVPAVTPVIAPVVEPMVATPVVPLIHVPPPVASVSVVVVARHIVVVPAIATGVGFTVITWARPVPHPVLYEIVVVPADTLVTAPAVPTVATPVFVLLQAPYDIASVNVVLDPLQTVNVPPIAAGVVVTD
jgi:hypothetical protein